MKKDNLIFIHKLLKAIADAIIIVFIPLYILKTTEDIKLSMAYLVIYSIFVMIFMAILKRFIQKYGVIAIMIHFIPIVIAEGLLSFLNINFWTVLFVATLMGLGQALYSVPINLIFTFGDKKTNVGKFMIATNVGKLIFTLVSGFILSSSIKNSFIILFIASVTFYILCFIPLIFAYKELVNNYNDLKNQPKEEINYNKWFIIFHISFGLFQPVMDNIVPLFLYMNNLSFKAVTIVIVLVEFLKIIANYISQAMVRKNKSLILILIGFFLFTISITGIIFIKNPIALYILSCTASVSFPLTFVPMFGLYCNHLKKNNNVFSGMTRRDFDIFSLRPAMYSLSFIGFALYPCLIIGLIAVPVMLISEIKLLKRD